MKVKTILIISGIAIALSATLYIFRKPIFGIKDNESDNDENDNKDRYNEPSVHTKPASVDTEKNAEYPLDVGSTGKNVKSLQTALNVIRLSKGLFSTEPLKADGIFGTKTKDMLTKLGYSTPIPFTIYHSILIN